MAWMLQHPTPPGGEVIGVVWTCALPGSQPAMDTSIHYGMTLSCEEHPPRRLLDIASLAEGHGFDFVSISDHYHPWVDAQGHSPFVWSILGALAERTSTLEVAVGVT